MRPVFALSTVAALTALSLSLFACAADGTSNDPSGEGTEQDLAAATNVLQGAWKVEDGSRDLSPNAGYQFNSDHTFSRETIRILNGLFVGTAPDPTERQSGTYTIDSTKKLVTLHVTSPREMTETLAYDFQGARALNGVFLPGHEPTTSATLTLTGQAAHGSQVAFPALKYDQTTPAQGEEGALCGGLAGLRCGAGLVCHAPAECCDHAGTCVMDSLTNQ